MKKIILSLILISIFEILSFGQGKHSLRWYPFNKTLLNTATTDSSDPIYSKDSTLCFAPAVSFDVYTRGSKTGKYSVGAIPGIGYNLLYNPYLWENSYLAGIGLFASAAQDESDSDIFTFEMTPVISILNWIKIGYGYQWNFGGTNEWILRIGIVKSL